MKYSNYDPQLNRFTEDSKNVPSIYDQKRTLEEKRVQLREEVENRLKSFMDKNFFKHASFESLKDFNQTLKNASESLENDFLSQFKNDQPSDVQGPAFKKVKLITINVLRL